MLPVQYADQSISNSHVFTRENASLFDVSHMLQTEIQGKKTYFVFLYFEGYKLKYLNEIHTVYR